MPADLQFMVLDLRKVATLVWSSARARALMEHTRIEWQPYRDSKVLNFVYSVLFWYGGPGTAEIRQDRQKIDARTERYFDSGFESFLEQSFAHGAQGVARYSNMLVSNRDYCLQAVQTTFRDAADINAQIAGKTREAIETLARIKLASSLALTGMGCYAALTASGVVLVMRAAQAGAVKLTADVAGEVIKPTDDIGANVKGVGYQLGKAALEEGGDKGAERLTEMGDKALETYGPKLVEAEHRIQRYSESLLRKIGPRKTKLAARRLGNAEADKTIASRAIGAAERNVKVGKFAGKAVPLVFAAWDVLDALKEYREDIGEGE